MTPEEWSRAEQLVLDVLMIEFVAQNGTPPSGNKLERVAKTLIRDVVRPMVENKNVKTGRDKQYAKLLAIVQQIRDSGGTWEEVGSHLGVSRQAAWERFNQTVTQDKRRKK